MAKVTTNIKVVSVESPEKIKAHFGKEILKQDYPVGYSSAYCNQVAMEKNIDFLVNSNCYQMKDVNIVMTVQRKEILILSTATVSNREHRQHWRCYRHRDPKR